MNDELDERTRATLHQILDSLAAGHGGTPTDRKLGLSATCFDSLRAQREGLAPLRSELDRISALRSVEDVRKESARLQKIGVNAPFTFTSTQDFKDATRVIADASQGGLGLPERDYYTRTDSSSRRLRRVYLAHVARTLTLAGEPPAQARSDARRILALETTLARASMPVEKLRDPYAIYHKMAVADLQAITPAFAWGRYLSDVGRPELRELNVEQPGFFRTFDRVLRTQPLGDWRAYLRWHYLDQAAPCLTRELVDEDFSFRSALTGAKALRPRWKRCLGQADNALGEALGQAYVARMFSPQAKQKALELVQNLEAVLRERLAGLEWMGDSTRQQAIVKLEAFANKIGYPDRWRDYSSLEVSDTSFVVNLFRATEFETARQLAKIGKPVDRAEWGMSAPTNNAYYNPSLNEIVFPAGILQPPFFDPDADEASNYGQIGATIGHEMTHGFDDEGRKFDAQGNLRDWWTRVDSKSFDQRAARIVRQYGGYIAVDTLHLNGKLTAGENIADLGGTKIAFAAFERAIAGKSGDRVGVSHRSNDSSSPTPSRGVRFGAPKCFGLSPSQIHTRLTGGG